MATLFEFRLSHPDENYARQAMRAGFRELDRLEGLLSRFREGGDVWRINHASPGEVLRIGEECHACLLRAAAVSEATFGAFDPTVGAAAALAREGRGREADADALAEALAQRSAFGLTVDEHAPFVRVNEERDTLDLGGIGKGFALDRVRGLLSDWGVENGLLCGGGSSLLAFGSPESGGWSVNLAGAREKTRGNLLDCSIGASGTGEQGLHLIDPRRGGQRCLHARAWAVATDAAAADAFSTAWMTMTREEIASVLRTNGHGLLAAVVEDEAGDLWVNETGGRWTPARSQKEGWSWKA